MRQNPCRIEEHVSALHTAHCTGAAVLGDVLGDMRGGGLGGGEWECGKKKGGGGTAICLYHINLSPFTRRCCWLQSTICEHQFVVVSASCPDDHARTVTQQQKLLRVSLSMVQDPLLYSTSTDQVLRSVWELPA